MPVATCGCGASIGFAANLSLTLDRNASITGTYVSIVPRRASWGRAGPRWQAGEGQQQGRVEPSVSSRAAAACVLFSKLDGLARWDLRPPAAGAGAMRGAESTLR